MSNVRSTFAQILCRISALGVCVVLVAAPFAYGGVEERFRAIAAAVLAGCCLISASGLALGGRADGRLSFWAPLPLFVLLVLAGAQILAGVRDPLSSASLFSVGTIYPAATRLAFASLLSAVVCVVLGGLLFGTPTAFRRLAAVCLATGAAIAAAGLSMRLLGDDRFIRGLPVVGDPFATFVNRNNAAGYLVLAMAAGLGLLRAAVEDGGRLFAGDRRFGSGWRPDRATMLIGLVAMIGLCLAGILASRSRGGVIAAAATLATAPIFFRGARLASRRAAVLAPLAVGVGLAFWLGLATPVVERLQALGAEAILEDGRIPHWRDAARAAAARPAVGAGLGTYGYAYQTFARNPSDKRFEHADGQFVELAVEGGAAGAVALLSGAVVAALTLFRLGTPPEARVTLAALVVGQTMHGMFDFAIVVPAVGLTAAVLWGACLSVLRPSYESDGLPLTASEPFQRRSNRGGGPIGYRFVGAVSLVVLAVAAVWAATEHRSAWEVYRVAASSALRRPDVDATTLEEGLRRLELALDDRPDDAEGQRTAAELRVALYRIKAADRLRSLDETLSEATARKATSLSALHRALNGIARSGASAGVDAVRRDPLVVESLSPAYRRYGLAAEACPGITGVRLPLACLSFLGSEGDPRGLPEIGAAARRFPAEPRVLRSAGRLARQAGDDELARRLWHAAFTLSEEGFATIASELTASAGPEEAVRCTVPDDPGAALRIGRDPAVDRVAGFAAPFGARLREIADELSPGPSRLRMIANAAGFEGPSGEAAPLFREAVAASPGDPELRAEHARFLWSEGLAKRAEAEMSVALALAPHRVEFRQLARAWRSRAATRR